QQRVLLNHNNPLVSDPPCNRRARARCCAGLGQVRRLTWACSTFSTAFRPAVSPTIRARGLRQQAKACRRPPRRCSPYLRSMRRKTCAGLVARHPPSRPGPRAVTSAPARRADKAERSAAAILATCCVAHWAEFSAAPPPERGSTAGSAGRLSDI